jgi:hypothetical protein
VSTLAVNAVTDANGGNTATINSMTPTADSLQGFRNRIINGDCRIDQRNAGAAVTATSSAPYCVDRWRCFEDTDGGATVQQVSDAPAGYSFSLKWTTTTADGSLAAGQYAGVDQIIEGFNTADLAFGTASAKTVTLSFWVKSSLTGTFGGALANNAFNRSYPFTYTISVADTWEYKTVTIAGDTTGTWIGATNGKGLLVQFGLGVGSTYSGTAGAWAGAGYISATGAVSVIGTLNATWFITGVQLEVGSVATPFERRPYGAELALCQRYYEKHSSATSNNYTAFAMVLATGTTSSEGYIQYCVSKRAAPTISISSLGLSDGVNAVIAVTSLGTTYRGTESALIAANVASGLTQFKPYSLLANNSATAYVDFSAEL